jgi:predicted membrane protein
MSPEGSPRATGRVVAGVILLALGAIFLLDNFGVIDAGDVFRYWPLILLGLGLTRLISPRRREDRGAGVVLTVLGTIFLARALEVPWFRLRLVWPALLLLLGVWLILEALRGKRGPIPSLSDVGEYARAGAAAGLEATRGLAAPPGQEGNVMKEFALMGGGDRVVTSQDFRGGEVTAIMGGFQIDLRGAAIAGESATIEIFTLFGGVEIKVPQAWRVVMSGTPILGVFTASTSPIRDESVPVRTLIVRGTAIMGGVEVKN